MGGDTDVMVLDTEDPLAVAAVDGDSPGDVAALTRLLAEHPGAGHRQAGRLRRTRLRGMSRSLLHVVTDWPGHYPNGAASVAVLVAAGAEVNARFTGPHTETPLHWAASSDDVAVLDALLDAGADIDAPGAVIGGGTPLADARAFAQWKAAHRLVERGAHTSMQDAATLGLIPGSRHLAIGHPTAGGDQPGLLGRLPRRPATSAGYLLDRGADINWIPGWEDRRHWTRRSAPAHRPRRVATQSGRRDRRRTWPIGPLP